MALAAVGHNHLKGDFFLSGIDAGLALNPKIAGRPVILWNQRGGASYLDAGMVEGGAIRATYDGARVPGLDISF